MSVYTMSKKEWAESLIRVLTDYTIYAPVEKSDNIDYMLMSDSNMDQISYEGELPVLPLKAFFFPIKENVVQEPIVRKRIILGVRNCDLIALKLLDAVFLDKDYPDPYYKAKRDNTILIGNDCHSIKETCHCTAYGLAPYPEENMDITISPAGDLLYLTVTSDRGERLLRELAVKGMREIEDLPVSVFELREEVRERLHKQNRDIPGLEETKAGLSDTEGEFWEEYAAKCVSCGACSFICPTCHCFLLIDRERFEKVKNWDACQYPSFERVAAGEDPLKRIERRLKNRYECKYIHKPEMFDALACTGCGRCIDACIGKIDKNKIIISACKKD